MLSREESDPMHLIVHSLLNPRETSVWCGQPPAFTHMDRREGYRRRVGVVGSGLHRARSSDQQMDPCATP